MRKAWCRTRRWIGFTYDDLLLNGEDLRFTDAGNTVILPHEDDGAVTIYWASRATVLSVRSCKF
ncbi:MAG TPA: hypothetical protein P5026_11555 [Kiritimatiellia bacterium]|nr:hypothetical protein [Kiritimatiellia bacterium]HRU71492.1 hypothetical protein [Kiritimatiellia bacterium]